MSIKELALFKDPQTGKLYHTLYFKKPQIYTLKVEFIITIKEKQNESE